MIGSYRDMCTSQSFQAALGKENYEIYISGENLAYIRRWQTENLSTDGVWKKSQMAQYRMRRVLLLIGIASRGDDQLADLNPNTSIRTRLLNF